MKITIVILAGYAVLGILTRIWDEITENEDSMTIPTIGYIVLWPGMWWGKWRYRK